MASACVCFGCVRHRHFEPNKESIALFDYYIPKSQVTSLTKNIPEYCRTRNRSTHKPLPIHRHKRETIFFFHRYRPRPHNRSTPSWSSMKLTRRKTDLRCVNTEWDRTKQISVVVVWVKSMAASETKSSLFRCSRIFGLAVSLCVFLCRCRHRHCVCYFCNFIWPTFSAIVMILYR